MFFLRGLFLPLTNEFMNGFYFVYKKKTKIGPQAWIALPLGRPDAPR
jgi:hypothetical protein